MLDLIPTDAQICKHLLVLSRPRNDEPIAVLESDIPDSKTTLPGIAFDTAPTEGQNSRFPDLPRQVRHRCSSSLPAP